MRNLELSLQPVYECGYGGCKAPMPPRSITLPSVFESTFGKLLDWVVVFGVGLLCARECEGDECPYFAQCSEVSLEHCALFLFVLIRYTRGTVSLFGCFFACITARAVKLTPSCACLAWL